MGDIVVDYNMFCIFFTKSYIPSWIEKVFIEKEKGNIAPKTHITENLNKTLRKNLFMSKIYKNLTWLILVWSKESFKEGNKNLSNRKVG